MFTYQSKQAEAQAGLKNILYMHIFRYSFQENELRQIIYPLCVSLVCQLITVQQLAVVLKVACVMMYSHITGLTVTFVDHLCKTV